MTRSPQAAKRRMELRRFATVRHCTAEWEPNGPNSVYVWEPLRVDPPADARPYTCYLDTVIFYDREGTELARTRHSDLHGASPHLILLDGTWYEVTGGSVVHRNNGWFMRWTGRRNTRHARMMMAGFPFFLRGS